MILFNTSDTAIILTLRQVVFIGMHLKRDTTKNKIFAGPTEITKYNYVILDMPISTERYEFMEFNLNGEKIGILDLNNTSPPKDLPSRNYCSNEGLNGGSGIYWISKKQPNKQRESR